MYIYIYVYYTYIYVSIFIIYQFLRESDAKTMCFRETNRELVLSISIFTNNVYVCLSFWLKATILTKET